jgi:hypothetical protein
MLMSMETLTRDQLAGFRGDLDHGNGAADLAVPPPRNGSRDETSPTAPPSRVCAGCGGDISGRAPKARWYSPSCRSRYRTRYGAPRQTAAVVVPPGPAAGSLRAVAAVLLDLGAELAQAFQ